MRDFQFKPDEGKKVVQGKSTYPDMLRLTLNPERAFSLAMDLLRYVEQSKVSASKDFEFTLFGKLTSLSEE